jgi:hypothetical protein
VYWERVRSVAWQRITFNIVRALFFTLMCYKFEIALDAWSDNARYSRCSYRVLQMCFCPEWCCVCGFIHNSQTRFTKLVHLSAGKVVTYRRRNILRLFVCVPRAFSFVGGRQGRLPQRSIGCATAEAQALLLWPSRSPDQTPGDYF